MLKAIKPRGGLLVGLLVAVVALMWLLRTCSSPDPYAGHGPRPSGGDTIDVAIQYSPLALYTYADTLGGFGYDFLKEIAEREGMTVKFHPVVTLDGTTERLTDGTYDLIVANIPRTDNFDSGLRFTEPVYLDRLVLVQEGNDSARISSQLDLAGREIWVPAHSPAVTRLRNLAAEIGDTIIIREDESYGPEQLFILAATGEIPLAVVNASAAKRMAADYPLADISTAISFTQFQSWLVNPADTAFADSLDMRIKRFKATPEYSRLVEKYGLAHN